MRAIVNELDELIRQRDAALRDLDRFDSGDKGSRWITHADEGGRLLARVRELDAQIEALL